MWLFFAVNIKSNQIGGHPDNHDKGFLFSDENPHDDDDDVGDHDDDGQVWGVSMG